MKATRKIVGRLIAGCVLTCCLSLSTLQTFAIEGLKVSVESTNAVLSWPSTNIETYIVQYRSNLNASSSWLTLTDFLSAASFSNITSFVHSNSVFYPPLVSGGTNGGGSLDPTNTASGGGTNFLYSTTGFYRVVRDGVYIVNITNGTTVSGTIPLSVEVGLDGYGSLSGFSILSSDENPVGGLQIPPLQAALTATWDTTQTTNGTYQLLPEAELGDDADTTTGAVKTIIVQNDISFPNGYQVAGNAMYLCAKTIHTNGTWFMDFYDDQTNHFGYLYGDVNSDGYCDYPGVPPPGFSIGLTDANGNQLPSSFYTVVVTTQPPAVGGSFVRANTSGSASGITKIVVERNWSGAKWSIGYMPVYGQYSDSSLDLFSLMGEIVGGIQNSVFGNNSVIESPYAVTPQPFQIRYPADWGQLASDLHDGGVRNFFYFGHGAADYIGVKDINYNLNVENLQFLLQNTPLLNSTNQHPFRFVFLDGCKTAGGDLCIAFGIPKKTMSVNEMQNRYGLRPRAFLAWKGYTNPGVKGTLNGTHKMFIEQFFQIWQTTNPNTGQAYTLREALDAAAINPQNNQTYTTLNQEITIYGCTNLLFYDGN